MVGEVVAPKDNDKGLDIADENDDASSFSLCSVDVESKVNLAAVDRRMSMKGTSLGMTITSSSEETI